MKWRSWPLWARWLLEVTGLVTIYIAVAGLGLIFSDAHISPVWSPTGVALAAVLLLGYRVWPGIWLGAFLANVIVLAANDGPISTTILTAGIISVGNTLEAVAGAFLIRRFVGERHPFDQVNDTFKFIVLGVLLAPILSASLGVVSLIVAGIAPVTMAGYLWWMWWLGDAIGILLVTPVLLVVAEKRWPRWSKRRWAEALFSFGLLAVITCLVFGKRGQLGPSHYHAEYLLIPIVIWITFRFGQLGATCSTLFVAVITLLYTARGYGPFVTYSTNGSLLMLQTYLAILAGMVLILAGSLTHREYIEAELRLYQTYLEDIVAERTAELTSVNEQLAQEITERQRAERILRKSEERFKGFVEQSFDIVAATDLEGYLTYVSPSVERISGYKPETMVGRHFQGFFAKADRKKALRLFTRVLQGDTFEGLTFGAVGLYRTVDYIELNSAPIYEDGQIVGAYAVFRDVSQRYLAEKSLQESKQMLELVMDNIPQFIFWKDTQSIYQWCNLNFARAAGVETPENIVGKTDYDLAWKKEEADAFRADDREVMAHDRAKLGIIEAQLQADGKQAWLATNKIPLHDEQGNVVGILGTYEDITERRQAAEKLRQRNRELAMLNEANRALSSTLNLDEVLKSVVAEVHRLPDVLACSVWLVDPATNELECCEVTDPQRQLVLGWRLSPGEGLVGWVAQHKQSLNVPDVRADERHFKGVDQKTGLELRSILTVPLQIKQTVIGVMQVVDEQIGRFDETHQTLLESLASTAAIAIQNAQLYEQARQDAHTKLALLHEVNHRVKNNLTAIIGLLYAERRHTSLEGRTYNDLINTLINRVQGLATVHELLSAAEWRPLPISNLIQQVINAALQIHPSLHIGVEVTPSSIEVSPTQANQLALIINELTTNAIKYAFAARERGQILVRITAKNGLTHVEFCDDGPGYPDDVLRLERHNVGLYLIQTLVQSGLQGELKLSNNNGAVTTIVFKTAK
jgi:PAS domain S-box-containing protein